MLFSVPAAWESKSLVSYTHMETLIPLWATQIAETTEGLACWK